MSAYANAGDQYKLQSAMTASPGELTLMLYEGCLKNLKLSKIHIEAKDYEKSNVVLQKAQAIIAELMNTLDMRYELSKQMATLYDYVINLIVWANVKKDIVKVDEAIEYITDMRDTWQKAVLLDRQQNNKTTLRNRSFGA
jgi:flagellar protein FliS